LGTELAAGIAGFTLIGYLVDRKFDTGDVGVITGASVGAVGGLYHLIRRSLEMARQQGYIDSGRKKTHGNDGDDQRKD
jgi:F0F1-type ATP synthase assembly protein I